MSIVENTHHGATDYQKPLTANFDDKEVNVLRRLQREGAIVEIFTTTTEEPYVGPIAWNDIHNIALRIGQFTEVFPKLQIERWRY